MDLHGSCACGRNVFVCEVPEDAVEQANIFFDNSSLNRRHLASPVTAWLQVPISWFHSATFAFYPDETHRSIRRTFVSPFDTSTRRNFCGYCGTQLSQYNEDAPGEEVIQITLGSIFEEDLEKLEAEGLLSIESSSEEDEQGEGEKEADTEEMEIERRGFAGPVQAPRHRGAPWYEELVRDTALGRVRRRKGGWKSGDGTEEAEWEIVEYSEDSDDRREEEEGTPGKRRRIDTEDNEMRT